MCAVLTRCLKPELAGVPEHHRAILVGVFVEHDAGGRPRQQLRQLLLALAQR
jgi:hypothetical protein